MTAGEAPSAAEVEARVDGVRERIASAGGDPARVRLVAVTKGFGVGAVRAALGAGLGDVGENYAQDLVDKATEVASAEVRWHFIGRLQRNKVRRAAPYVALWQSVDRLAVGTEIARRAPGARVLAQVDLTGEPTKGGCPQSELPALLEGLTGLGLEVCGLMGIGPLGPPEDARPGFRELSRLADEYGLSERSMGMSADLEVAVQEGATMVRVGAGLFGPRPGSSGVRH